MVAALMIVTAFVMPSMMYAGDHGIARIGAPPSNSPPELVPLAEVLGVAGVSLEFSASASDPDGDELTYTWAFGDGSPLAVGNPVTHTYGAAGRYTYSVHVDDSRGNNVSSSATSWAAFPAQLCTGWNLFSLPLVGWSYMASTLGLEPGDVICSFDTISQTFKESYTIGISPPFKDFPIVPGKGYAAYLRTAKTLNLYGYPPTERQVVNITLPVYGGWVLMGFLGLKSHRASHIPEMCTGGRVMTVARYVPEYGVYQTWVWGGPPIKDFDILPGVAVWIWLTSSCSFSYDP